MSERKKKIFGPIEIFAFLATVGILAFLGLKQSGGRFMERTEQIEIIDNPSHNGGKKQKRKYESTNEESVEAILEQLADQYSGGKASYPKQQLEDAGISKDEMEFLEEVKEKKLRENEAPSIDWFSVLRSSHKTYAKVKSVFENAGIDVDQAESNLTSKLANEVAARTVYSKIEEVFNIPEDDARAFAQKGEKALSDWARFVEEKKQ